MTKNEPFNWKIRWCVEKYANEEAFKANALDDCIIDEGNLIVYGGYSALWDLLIGAANVSAFNNSNAHIGVGDDDTSAAIGQTDLQAVSNTFYSPMASTYPQHTDGTGESNASLVFRSTFGADDANFAWEEWGIFNASTSGRMLNRRVAVLGTKANPAIWTFTVTLSDS